MTKNITKATIKSIIRNGGATFDYNGNRVTMKSGYQVSTEDLMTIEVRCMGKELIKRLIANRLSKRGEYLGLWIDNGWLYIDISRRVATKKQAMAMGRELNQLTILRWADMECLAVN